MTGSGAVSTEELAEMFDTHNAAHPNTAAANRIDGFGCRTELPSLDLARSLRELAEIMLSAPWAYLGHQRCRLFILVGLDQFPCRIRVAVESIHLFGAILTHFSNDYPLHVITVLGFMHGAFVAHTGIVWLG